MQRLRRRYQASFQERKRQHVIQMPVSFPASCAWQAVFQIATLGSVRRPRAKCTGGLSTGRVPRQTPGAVIVEAVEAWRRRELR